MFLALHFDSHKNAIMISDNTTLFPSFSLLQKSPLNVCFVELALDHICYAQNSPQDFLDAHNAARADVGVGPMTWSSTVAAYTHDYIDQRIAHCKMVHSGGPYGENIAWGIQFTHGHRCGELVGVGEG